MNEYAKTVLRDSLKSIKTARSHYELSLDITYLRGLLQGLECGGVIDYTQHMKIKGRANAEFYRRVKEIRGGCANENCSVTG